jgi:hypothetical protein
MTAITRPGDSPLCVSACPACGARWLPGIPPVTLDGSPVVMTLVHWSHHADLMQDGFEIFEAPEDDENSDIPDALCRHLYVVKADG